MSARYVREVAVMRLIKTKDCCPSCHNEWEDSIDTGNHPPDDYDLGKGRYANLCCSVRTNFEKWKKERGYPIE